MVSDAYGSDFWIAIWAAGGGAFSAGADGNLLEAHWPKLMLPANTSVLVPLSGKSPDMMWLRNQGYAVTGVEISPIACEAFFSEHRLVAEREQREKFIHWSGGGLTVLQGDFFDLDGTYDSALDRGALVAFPQEQRVLYANQLLSCMISGGKLLCVTVEYEAQALAGPPFPVLASEMHRLFPGVQELMRLPLRKPRWRAINACAVIWIYEKPQ